MPGQANIEAEAKLVPRHFTLTLNAAMDGTAAMELIQILADWDDAAAGGFVGAIRGALVEANGGRQLEVPQPVIVPDDPPDDDGRGEEAMQS